MLWKKVSIGIVVVSLMIFHVLTMYTDDVFYYRVYMYYDGCNFSVTNNLFDEPRIDKNDCGIPEVPLEDWYDMKRKEDFPELPYNITFE